MSHLHLLVVVDSETGEMHLGTLQEMPVDSDESVWDTDTEEWRPPTRDEIDKEIEAGDRLLRLIHPEVTA